MVKRIEYYIVALTENGAHFDLVKGLESEEDAQAHLAKIMVRISQREGRYVSLGDVVFDPSPIVAYCVREGGVWDLEEDDTPQEITLDKPGLTASAVTTPGAPSGVTYALPDTPDTIQCTQDVSL